MNIGAVVLVVFFAFLATFVQRVSGFGFGILLTFLIISFFAHITA